MAAEISAPVTMHIEIKILDSAGTQHFACSDDLFDPDEEGTIVQLSTAKDPAEVAMARVKVLAMAVRRLRGVIKDITGLRVTEFE